MSKASNITTNSKRLWKRLSQFPLARIRYRFLFGVMLLLVAFTLMLSTPSYAKEHLTVWWNKGYYQAEDNAIRAVVSAFEKKTGIKVDLSLLSQEDIVTKAIAAVTAGDPPDVAFGAQFDLYAFGQWAYDNQLDNVSDIIKPMQDTLLPVARQGVFVLNGHTGEKSYYGVPISVTMVHVFYWQDLLKKLGYDPSDIPTGWNAFWNFWCGDVQSMLRKKRMRIYAVGNPTSVTGDTFAEFTVFLAAYNVHIVDQNGKLLLDQPDVHQSLVDILKQYVGIYQRGCTPPSSISWNDASNNDYLNNRTTVMTLNGSLSIPGYWLDQKNYKIYDHDLVTALMPNAIDGKPLINPVRDEAAVIFAAAKHKASAHAFLAFLMQPKNYDAYLRAGLGRNIPVTKDWLTEPFWTNDPQRGVAVKAYSEPMQPMPQVYNYRLTKVNSENVWGEAMLRMIQRHATAEQAVNWMAQRIKELVGQ